ncbi:ABC transporter ATP-binding protein [Profundibacter sp.]|uniref:ABC transporter ATP-binding protein n=1 Tax=Profundibacter sp. TaxID=3101071 RepID=UPI003D135B80
MNPENPLLKVRALTRLMIGPVSFGVGAGECVAITGPSGTGKSVLLRAIVDLDPNDGQVQAGDVIRADVPAPDWRKTVAMLPAESGWWLDHVAPHFQAPDKIRGQLPLVGLPETAMEWEVARLSTGEKHRLALLRCLEGNPKVLLLDEPTAALDHNTTLQIEALLKQQLDKGTAILIVTHDAAQAKRLAHRILHLEDGQLHQVAA